MNGVPRDRVDTDIAAGYPTLSPKADIMALKVARLMTDAEARSFWNGLQRRLIDDGATATTPSASDLAAVSER